jgi:FMN-dependent NADH-azoreductase
MKLLHVDASAKREWSNSRALSRHFIDLLKQQIPTLEVDYLDVAADTPAHVSEAFTVATYTPAADRTPAMKQALEASDALCKRVLDADAFVFAMPMYNFSMPSVFKAFIDNIVRTDLTYKIGADGSYQGQLAPEKVLFLTTRGADLRPGSPMAGMDALTPALRAAFGFLGVASPTFVDAQPLTFSAVQEREAALVRAKDELAALAQRWAA